MDNGKVAEKILWAVGGSSNINNATHCATRLRLSVRDESIIDEEELKKITEVLGLVKNSNEYQIIIGPGVEMLYVEFLKAANLRDGSAAGNLEKENENGQNQKKLKSKDIKIKKHKGIKGILFTFTDFIAASFMPCLPIIVAGGMISAVLVICTTYLGLSTESGTYRVWNSIYTAGFYFLPIYVGYNAAKKMEMEPMLGALLGGVLTCADINGVEGLSFFGIPITPCSYNTTVLPVIFGVVFMSYTNILLAGATIVISFITGFMATRVLWNKKEDKND